MSASSPRNSSVPARHEFSEIEPLESRIAPAVFIVTSLADAGAGTLRQALASADTHPGFDTILFHLPAPAVHSENIITLATGQLTSLGNVAIVGPGAGKLIINGNGTSRVLSINDGSATTSSPVSISGLSIVDGNAGTGNGGGIRSDEPLTLKNVVISDCRAAAGGGLLLGDVPQAHLKANISHSIISGNTATTVAGGMSLYDLDSLKLANTVVTGNVNSSTSHGAGGLYVEMNTTGIGMTIANCVITDNSADHGGGLFVNSYSTNLNAKINITGTIISGNTSTNATALGGGGLYIQQGAAINILGSTISGNTSRNSGGGIEAKGVQSLNIVTTLISGNTAANVGAGFNIFGNKSVNIVGSVISGNADSSTSHGAGGGYAEMNADAKGISIVASVFSGNNANHGGGLFVNSYATSAAAKITISATKITGNVSNGASLAGGGGLYIGKGNVAIIGSQISNNLVDGDDGGGIEAKGFYSLSISKSVISGNQTLSANGGLSNGGGGIYLVNGGTSPVPATITGTLIGANTSHAYGGGLAAADGVNVTISKSVFSTNHASVDAGGGISTYGKNANAVNLTISGSTLKGNVTGKFGGGININGTGTLSVGSSTLFNNIASGAGGGIDVQTASLVTITDVIATHNTSGTFGGGIEFVATASFSVSGGSFTGNFAANAGGAIDTYNSTGSIMGVTISGNVAETEGGGVSHFGSGTVTLQVATVIANTAPTSPDIFGTFILV